jgi:hypothetical protein
VGLKGFIEVGAATSNDPTLFLHIAGDLGVEYTSYGSTMLSPPIVHQFYHVHGKEMNERLGLRCNAYPLASIPELHPGLSEWDLTDPLCTRIHNRRILIYWTLQQTAFEILETYTREEAKKGII